MAAGQVVCISDVEVGDLVAVGKSTWVMVGRVVTDGDGTRLFCESRLRIHMPSDAPVRVRRHDHPPAA
jgi:hypothetical protein